MKVTIRPLREIEIAEAETIYRQSFSNFLRIPEWMLGDVNHVRARFRASPETAWAAELDGKLIGSAFATRWGSVAVLGPATVQPKGFVGNAGHLLMQHLVDVSSAWGAKLQVAYTFAQSPKHTELHAKLGMWPRFLTGIMTQLVKKTGPDFQSVLVSSLEGIEREAVLEALTEITHAIYEGLDLTQEIQAVARCGLGDTLFVGDDDGVAGFAVCHVGAGTEAGSDTCYVKFGAVRPGPGAEARFELLLDECEAYARLRGVQRLVCGVSLGRVQAFQRLQQRGFQITFQGVAMHRPNVPAHTGPGDFVIDDWR